MRHRDLSSRHGERADGSPAVARQTSTAVDVLLACSVAGLSLAEVLTGQVSGPPVAGVVIALLFGATMLTWRRAPFATLLGCYALMVLSVVLNVSLYNFLGSVVAGVLVVASVAVHYRFWPAVAGQATAYVTLLLTALRDPGGWLWGAFIIGAAFAAGRLVRSRALLIADLRATTEELERSRDQQARAAVIEERTRIAREMHDVVAHAVSVMVVQAGAAQRTLKVDPERAAAAMEAVQVTGSTALVDLRRMLGVLRLEPGQAELGPQPGSGRPRHTRRHPRTGRGGGQGRPAGPPQAAGPGGGADGLPDPARGGDERGEARPGQLGADRARRRRERARPAGA